jgi:hypothetical protein
MAKKTKPRVVSVELVVRRGALRRFQNLKDKAAKLPVDVVWDRREGERRIASDSAGADQRTTDRRQKPPFTWELSDFVVVPKSTRRSGK